MNDVLPWLNLLLIPGMGYLMAQDRKIVRLEVLVNTLTTTLVEHAAREERFFELLVKNFEGLVKR